MRLAGSGTVDAKFFNQLMGAANTQLKNLGEPYEIFVETKLVKTNSFQVKFTKKHRFPPLGGINIITALLAEAGMALKQTYTPTDEFHKCLTVYHFEQEVFQATKA